MSGGPLERLAAWVARRPVPVLAAVVALALAGAALAAATLRPSSGTDTLVGRSSDSWQATERYHERFGEDAVYVLVRQDLVRTLLTEDLQRVLGLEGCLSGNAPAGATPAGGPDGPCAQLARTKPVQVVYGPGTFVNESVRQISDQFTARSAEKAAQAKRAAQAAERLALRRGYSPERARQLAQQARRLVDAQFTRDVLALALRYGLRAPPQINDAGFVSTLVFADGKPTGTPKARFAYLFPNSRSALIQVRLKPGLGDDERRDAIALIRQAVAMPDWALQGGGRYVTTGAPVVLDDLSDAIADSLVVLLVAALLVMAATLALVFRARLRLLPLAVALCASALTFAGLALAGLPLTMASIGVLPVLIGLAVDYAIQFQSRTIEEGSPVRAARVGGPTIATAGAATAAGFLVLALSPVPMVRQFGLLLVAGIAVALVCTITAGTAALAVAGRRRPREGGPLGALATAARGAEALLTDNAVARRARAAGAAAGRGVAGLALRRGRVVLVAGVAVAAIGWGLDTQADVESDVNRLVPQDMPALQDLRDLQETTGVGGQIDVMVTADDLTDPAVIQWMSDYQERLLRRYDYNADRPCGEATLCPAFSLPDLFDTSAGPPTQADVRAILDAVPPYFSQAVITPARDAATLAFGIRLMPLDEQQHVIETMREELDPPAGVRAELVGLPVLAADANAAVSSPWRRIALLLGGLVAVAAVLLLAFRSLPRALVPLAPIALATGWSSLVLFALRVELNPMSVTLGALVVAISTEFSVLLAERYRQERAAGHGEAAALERTYRSTGAAVLASGATAIAGFAVLVVSDIQMLRDFGWVTVVDLTVSLLGVLVVLPTVLVLADRRGLALPRGVLARRRAGRAAAP
ncbi:MAG TPA: MMPL family transporter [Capillimicrobium sp.]|nr:MMPL family transporter [Capillimicrobium sp.]